jgi:hypothetical protein
VITGDNNKYAKILIQQHSKLQLRKEDNFEINHGVIGRKTSKKTWYTYNKSSLNGVFRSPFYQMVQSLPTVRNTPKIRNSVSQARRLNPRLKYSEKKNE